jgi:hypothetical protein
MPLIARDTWRFYQADVDPGTHLPLDNLKILLGWRMAEALAAPIGGSI